MTLRLNGSTSGYIEIDAPAVAGTRTLVLPTDSIQPGLVLLNTTSFSAASTVSVNNCFSSTYDNYLIKLLATNSSAGNFLTRLRTSSDDSGANYSDQLLYGSGSTASANRQSGQTSWRTGYAGTSDSGTLTLELFAPNLAAYTKGNFGGCVFVGSTQEATYGSVAHNATTQFTGFTIFPSVGNFTGTVRVYGYRNS
jgi:hypothetical protein